MHVKEIKPKGDSSLHRSPSMSTNITAETNFSRVNEGNQSIASNWSALNRLDVPDVGQVIDKELIKLLDPNMFHPTVNHVDMFGIVIVVGVVGNSKETGT